MIASQRPAWSQLLNPVLPELTAYSSPSGEFRVRLDANEAPKLLSAAASQELVQSLATCDWHRYPESPSAELRQAIAKYCGVRPEQTLVGVGSDEIIQMLLCSFGRTSKAGSFVLALSPSFVMYRMTARIHGHQVIEVQLDAKWDLKLDSVLKAVDYANPSLIFIASPNNPTGTLVSEERLRALAAHARDSLIVVDEAYIDYADRQQLQLLEDYDNVVVLRTLSKVGFAALRLGWLLASPDLVRELDKVRLPYNISRPSQILGTQVLSALGGELIHTRRYVVAERTRVLKRLEAMPGVDPVPSQANFIWFKTHRPAEDIDRGLRERGILVRSFHEHAGRLKPYLRVTIGLEHENSEFLAALEALV